MKNSKELYDYWYEQVRLHNYDLIRSEEHVETYRLRHGCTNYDALRKSSEVQSLTEPDKSINIGILKYQCTARVLQARASALRERAQAITISTSPELNPPRLLRIIRALQEMIFGKDKEIERLQAQIRSLEVEREAFVIDVENSKLEIELQKQLSELQKRFEKEEKRRRELGRNNQSLGGRLSHTNRYIRERDEAREEVKQLKLEIKSLNHDNEKLRLDNERLHARLMQFLEPQP